MPLIYIELTAGLAKFQHLSLRFSAAEQEKASAPDYHHKLQCGSKHKAK